MPTRTQSNILKEIRNKEVEEGVDITKKRLFDKYKILCDSIKFKCQTQVGGGVKMMLPCNSLSWVQRCGDQYQYGGGGSAYLNKYLLLFFFLFFIFILFYLILFLSVLFILLVSFYW